MRAYMSIKVEMKAMSIYNDQRNPNPLSRLDNNSLEKNMVVFNESMLEEKSSQAGYIDGSTRHARPKRLGWTW